MSAIYVLIFSDPFLCLYTPNHSHAIHNKATSHSNCEALSNINCPARNQISVDLGTDYDLIEAMDPKRQQGYLRCRRLSFGTRITVTETK